MDKDTFTAIAEGHAARWNPSKGNDERLENFKSKFFEWLFQMPEEAHPDILRLFDGFCYYPHDVINNLLVELHSNLQFNYQLDSDRTIYTFIKSKNNISNSSNDYWSEYKHLNGINKQSCIIAPDELTVEEWEEIEHIIFIDDCSGSGKTFCDYIENRNHKYKNKRIFFITVHIMADAKLRIKQTAENNDLDITVIEHFTQDKAFSSNLFPNDEKTKQVKELIIRLSKEKKIHDNDILGYQNTESLMAFYNNTPNNTLGFIRCDTRDYFSIFPREKTDMPGWRKAAHEKKARKAKNYNYSTK